MANLEILLESYMQSTKKDMNDLKVKVDELASHTKVLEAQYFQQIMKRDEEFEEKIKNKEKEEKNRVEN